VTVRDDDHGPSPLARTRHAISSPLAAIVINLELAQRELAERGDGFDVTLLRELLHDSRAAAEQIRAVLEGPRLGPDVTPA
jgi:hypothetical protein